MRAAIGFWALLLVSACGGNVVVEQGSGGATSTTVSSSGTGAAGTTTVTTSSSTGTFPDCTTFGALGVGLKCNQEGTTCHMAYACCQGLITCQGGVWTAQYPACKQTCLQCGDGLWCKVGGICVHDTSVYDSYQCTENPCPGMPDCMCASFACAMNYEQCKSTQMYTVTCGN
jgi:hypothetical protein